MRDRPCHVHLLGYIIAQGHDIAKGLCMEHSKQWKLYIHALHAA